MKRKELEKLPVLRATTAMLKQAENEPMIESGYFRKELRYSRRCKTAQERLSLTSAVSRWIICCFGTARET